MATSVGAFNDVAFNIEEFNAAPEISVSWMQQQLLPLPSQVRQALSPGQLASMSSSGVLIAEPNISWLVQHPHIVRELEVNSARILFISTFPLFSIIKQPFTLIDVVGSDDTAFLLRGEAGILDGLIGSYIRELSLTASQIASIETVGSQAVQLAIEGSVSTKSATGESKRTFSVIGEYRPTRSVKGGFDG